MAGNASPYVKPFNCPNCGGPQTIRALGQSVTYACTQCGALIDINSEPYKIIGESMRAEAPGIPLGTKGTFDGIKFEVVGYLARLDKTQEYEWREYLLFNPYKGYRWLTESDGHWNFVTMLKANPVETLGGVVLEGRRFRRFIKDRPHIRYVRGEFYWRIKAGDRVESKDYISPPYMLSQETDMAEVNYSLGEYLPRQKLIEAFAPAKIKAPSPKGVGINQPGYFEESYRSIYKTAAVAIGMLFLVQLIFSIAASNRNVLDFTFEPLTAPQITNPFKIDGNGNLGVTVFSKVDNSWVEVEATLTNVATQEDYEADVEVAYYHGCDSDGCWSEDAQVNDTTIGPVPAGTYQLRVDPTYDPVKAKMPFRVTLRRDVPYWGNFWIAAILISLPAILVFIARLTVEGKRQELYDWN